jgi:PII-like signaling protein
MPFLGEKVLLRIHLQSADRAPRTPTYERVVQAARREGLAGATVLRGILGAGYHGLIRPSPLSLVEHVPVIVEIVDDGEKIAAFVRGPLAGLMVGGMITLERAAVLLYRSRPKSSDVEPSSTQAIQLAAALPPLSTVPNIETGPLMNTNENGVLLRVFIGEADRFDRKPLYEAIVEKARELGLAGATVLRGSEGFGASSVVHRAGLLEMSADLPIVIEIVDNEPNVQKLLPALQTMVTEGMITMEHVTILAYRSREKSTAG